jgi:16S rRNA (guanine966-N2)-methyltransferase
MRIVAGEWAGKDLMSPGKRVRATAEEVRDRMLTYLEPYLEGARVVDLFAGSGALGLEALSRGAALADFVEDAPVALHALKANVAARKLRPLKKGVEPGTKDKVARIFKKDAIPFVLGLHESAYDLALVDPPYRSRKLDLVIQAWEAVRFAAILAVEHAADHEVPAGGKRLELGEICVTVYGQPRRRPQTRSPAAAQRVPDVGGAPDREPPKASERGTGKDAKGRTPGRGAKARGADKGGKPRTTGPGAKARGSEKGGKPRTTGRGAKARGSDKGGKPRATGAGAKARGSDKGNKPRSGASSRGRGKAPRRSGKNPT